MPKSCLFLTMYTYELFHLLWGCSWNSSLCSKGLFPLLTLWSSGTWLNKDTVLRNSCSNNLGLWWLTSNTTIFLCEVPFQPLECTMPFDQGVLLKAVTSTLECNSLVSVSTDTDLVFPIFSVLHFKFLDSVCFFCSIGAFDIAVNDNFHQFAADDWLAIIGIGTSRNAEFQMLK